MTPPDSGEMIGVCELDGFPKSWPEHDDPHRPLPSCVNWEPVAVAPIRKPDSGEREVCGYFEKDEGWDSRWDAHSRRRCWLAGGHALPHDYAPVSLPLSLAQRILAALEEAYGFVPIAGKELQALAAELRAVMPKGTR